jgi:hypothetical protein
MTAAAQECVGVYIVMVYPWTDYIRLINLKPDIYILAGAKIPTGQTIPE